MSVAAAAGGSGSGGGGGGGRGGGVGGGRGGGVKRKRPRCVARGNDCQCRDCCEWQVAEIEKFRQRRIDRRKALEAAERDQKNLVPQPMEGLPTREQRLQQGLRRVMGPRPEIYPLYHPDQGPKGVEERTTGPSPMQSRWLISAGRPRGDWKTILDQDKWNIGYINRLYYEWDQPMMLADIIDGFCRDRQRLAEVLEILGSTCIFLRLVPDRNNPRDLMTAHQLDTAYKLEHATPLEQSPALVESEEHRLTGLGIGCAPDDPELWDLDHDLELDPMKMTKRKD